MAVEKMTASERRATASLAAVMTLRLLGLFMILPVFSLYAHDLTGSTPFLIGVAMGVYGLTQAVLQIPFGFISDHVGRKPVITAGLLVFLSGSLIAAYADTINWMILGRALQGAGAVGSTIIALLADLTRDSQRTKAMAVNGITIGMSFSLAMIAGPVFAAWLQVSGIFFLAAGCSVLAIVVLYVFVPSAPAAVWHADAEVAPTQFFALLKAPQLARLNAGILLLHAIFTASFVVIPISLKKFADIPGNQQWALYLPALLLAFVASLALIVYAEKRQQIKPYFVAGILALAAAEILLLAWPRSVPAAAAGIFLFFAAFSLLEAFLPSLVSRAAPAASKGTALGIYSCAQFLGIFIGGTLGGWLYGYFGLLSVYLFCVLLALLWLPIASGMKSPPQPRRN
jgi:MFS family permease